MKLVKKNGKEFKIIPEAKIVQAKTNKKFLMDELHGLPLEMKAVIRLIADDKYTSDQIIYATAYCDEKDTFDENIGMLVSAEKLDKKNHLRLAKECDRVYKTMVKCAKFLRNKRDMHLKKAQSIEDDMVKTYGRLRV